MPHKKKDKILAPLEEGRQKYAIRSNADIVCFTGNTGGGKSFALYYSVLDYLIGEPNSKLVCFMRNISDFWGAGKVADTLKQMLPLVDRSIKKQPHDPIGELIRNTQDMGVKLYNGSEIKFQQLDNESPIVIDKIAKGLQTKKLVFDECNKFLWRTITFFFPRLRSDSKGKAQVFLAQNPERESPLRQLCGKGEHGGGWIFDDGSVDASMNGVVMFVFMPSGDPDKAVFGRTKEEVYAKCRNDIDALLAKDEDLTYKDFILSMAFFDFDARENKKMLAKNKTYRGFTANSATAASSYASNWNYSINDDLEGIAKKEDIVLKANEVERMFRPVEMDSHSEMLKRIMTVDFATTGTDNLVLKYWELWSKHGWICKDIAYSTKNTNREAVLMIMNFRSKHNLQEKDMILDVQGFGFLRDCFPRAICFSGASQPSNRAKTQFKAMKDEAAHLATEMIQAGLIHYEPHLAKMHYAHNKMKRSGGTTILAHMVFEGAIFQFSKTPNGRIAFMEKEKQHSVLKGMSPDLFDNVIMLCGGQCYDCYRLLRDDAGVMRKKMESSDMLYMLGVNGGDDGMAMPYERKKKITRVDESVLSIFSTI